MMIKKTKRVFIMGLLCGMLLPVISIRAHSQHSPADEYYNNNMDTQTPSQTHYNKNLRAGGDEWEEDDGPGGGGEGGNTGVGVPVGNGSLPVMVCLVAYGIYASIRKKRKTI